jgi:protein-S-isoprenylcysteine O-methyltransferase Ste14
LLLWIEPNRFSAYRLNLQTITFRIGAFLLISGLALATWTVRLQITFGESSPAPWDPVVNLVNQGPYHYQHNPMISGALMVILAESLIFRSWLIFLWFVIFVIFNLITIPLIEEKRLGAQFGSAYQAHKEQFPRWIPRFDLRG